MLEWDSFRYIIDCGPDFRQQLLREKVQNINGILFTHEHADHTAGLDDIRPFCHKNGDLPIYLPERIVDNFHQRFEYVFTRTNRYPGAPSVIMETISNQPFMLGSKRILPIEFLHGKISIFGYRIDNFAYLTDLKSIEDDEKLKLNDLDVLVINALRIEPHPTHLCLSEALAFIDELKPKRAYLTHISHRLGFHSEVQKMLPSNVFLAYDRLKVTL